MGFASASRKVNTIEMATQEWTVGINKTYKCLSIANILLFLPCLITKKAIYPFLRSTKTHINSERQLGLWFEESAYAFASQRQPLWVPFLFLFTTRLLAKSVSQFPVCTVFFKVNVVLGGNTDKQMEQCKYQDTKTFMPSFFTATRALDSADFQQFINEFGFPGQV